MPSVLERLMVRTLIALLMGVAACVGPSQAQAPDHGPAITREQVQSARNKVKADPNLGGVRQEKTLRFKESDGTKPKDKREKGQEAPAWLTELARWLAEAGRLVIWAIGAIGVALLAVGLRHWIKVRGDAAAVKSGLKKLPSHIRDLDIRPEGLPPHISAAARALARAGDHRAALSLLYRGALSRLVHQHGVAIGAASTEGECVQLAGRRLDHGASGFFAKLVAAWQLAVYGGRLPDADAVLALCDAFDAQLGSGPGAMRKVVGEP